MERCVPPLRAERRLTGRDADGAGGTVGLQIWPSPWGMTKGTSLLLPF